MDPFAGAGTTGLAALGLGRSFLGVEISPTYALMASRRFERDGTPLLAKTRVQGGDGT